MLLLVVAGLANLWVLWCALVLWVLLICLVFDLLVCYNGCWFWVVWGVYFWGLFSCVCVMFVGYLCDVNFVICCFVILGWICLFCYWLVFGICVDFICWVLLGLFALLCELLFVIIEFGYLFIWTYVY